MSTEEENTSFDIELEKIKLERFRIASKVLTVLITVGMGTFGVTWINSQIQQQKILAQTQQQEAEIELQNLKTEAENQKEEMKYLGDYLKYALDDNVERRRRFAEYFAALTVSKELQQRWVAYKSKIEELIDKEAQQEAELSDAIKRNDKAKITELERQLAETKSKLRNISKDWKSDLKLIDDESVREIMLDILAAEGGYADNPSDPLGASKYGITLQSLRRLYGSDLSKEDLQSLTKENAISFYHKHVFLRHGLNKLPKALWLPIFDATVNSGNARSIKWLQSVCVDEGLKVDIDGFLGASTIECANELDHRLGAEFVRKIVEKRLEFLRGLSTWKVFGKGWERRVSRLLPE